MASAGDDLLRSISATALAGELHRAAASWRVEGEPGRRPSCGLCLADRSWIAEAPALATLPHAISHAVVVRIDTALQAAEFDAHEYAEEDAWVHRRLLEAVDDEIDAAMRAFDERARRTVLAALDALAPDVARVRESLVEPALARYLDRHTMTEPPWPWTME